MKKTIRNFKETVEIRSSFIVRIRSHRYTPAAAVCLAVLGMACVHIWQRVHVLAVVHEIGLLRQENRLLADDTRKVYSEVSSLSMSTRVQEFAADSLGLSLVAADMIITMEPPDDGPKPVQPSDINHVLYAAAKRVTDFVPRVTENAANAGELFNPIIDSLANGGGD